MAGIDELRRSIGGNVAESTGRPPLPVYGASPAGGPRQAPPQQQGTRRSRDAAEIEVSRIKPDPGQPREVFDEAGIARLAESLRTRGQLQPIRVRWDEASGHYLIVCGERRWRASMLAELPTLSCVVMDGPVSPADLLAMQLIENLLREDLQPVEQAKAYRSLMEANAWSARQLARELALDHTLVVRSLALLELPADVQDRVERGELSPTSAYEVSKIDGDPAAQSEVAARVVAEGLNRAETVAAVKRASATKGRGGPSKARKPVVRTHRLSEGKLTIELRKGLDVGSIAPLLRSALALYEGQEAVA